MVASTNFHVKIYNAGDSGDRDDQDFFNDDPFNGNEVQGYFLHRGYQGDRDKQEGSASLKTSEQKKNHATCKMCFCLFSYPSSLQRHYHISNFSGGFVCMCICVLFAVARHLGPPITIILAALLCMFMCMTV